jgi:homoserine dehydrogenase
MNETFKIAVAGLGTVGAGVIKILQDNADVIAMRAGRRIEIVAVSARDKNRDRGVDVSRYQWVENPANLVKSGKIDALVEVIGGAEDPAHDVVKSALSSGINVVTANKALLASHGFALAEIAEKNNVNIRFEASVAGCVPVIKALREGFAGNKISAVYGILNGTCNYILTQMRESGRGFAEVLKEAQAKGYAEADPTFDVDGIDAAHKLAILSAIAFGVKPDIKGVEASGIRRLTATDIKFAGELGYRIKLLGIAKIFDEKISQVVEPCLVPIQSPLGGIEDVYNAAFIEGDFIETPLLTGRGAGAGPTASAVVADIIDLARGNRIPVFGVSAAALRDAVYIDRGSIQSRYYLRLTVKDVPGVIADVGAILRDHDISVESLVQHGRDPAQAVSLVLITHESKHANIIKACAMIAGLKVTMDDPCLIRIEEL